MRKGLLIALLSAVLAAVAAVMVAIRPAPPPAVATPGSGPVPYPADMVQQVATVPGLSLGAAEELPADLAWQTGEGQPDIGDPAAVKGGRVRLSSPGPYPAHWLLFGSEAPQFFHANAFANVEVALVARHPQTGASLPGTAEAWAVRGDSVYFRLNPRARYSNGRPVRAGDYVLGALLRARCGESLPVAELRALGDGLLSVRLEGKSPCPEQAAAALLHAAEPGFYADFGSDYRNRYARRIPPTTGAYTIGRCERGRLIELVRVRDWWAANLPYYRYTCNVDAIEYHFLTDEAQAWEFLLRGRLDALQTRHPAVWQQRLPEAEARGLVPERFRADYPMPPYGIALNAESLPDLNLRRGLLCALDMAKAVSVLFCGEGECLSTFSTGYGALSPADTPRCRYAPAEARAFFAAAGYTEQGADGILRRTDGRRLRVRFLYSPNAKTAVMADVFTASARACGVELACEAAPWQGITRRTDEGDYDLLFWATAASSPLPDYRRFFGPGAKGPDAPFRCAEAELMRRIAAYEAAPSAVTIAAVDVRIAELAVWLPGWKENRVLLLHSPRLRFPDCPGCRFSTPAPYEIMEAHLYWIQP